MHDDELGPTVEAIVKSSRRITPESHDEVREISLQIDEPSFRYIEGQSIGVVIPGPHPFGNKYHIRRYSIARDNGTGTDGIAELTILVRRCFYVDEMNGEEYPGIASNYLCDATPGDKLTLTGPFKSPFKMPPQLSDNMLMISTGTGIAPFRSFIQQIHKQTGHWQGNIRLFYGAKSGMDLLYMNDINNDLANYFDEQTFQAYCGLAGHPLAEESDGLEHSIEDNAQEIWSLLQQSNTYVYLAGLKSVSETFDRKLAELAGSKESWDRLKQELHKEGRFSELLYN